MATDVVKVLIVDDLPEKLLVYRSVLEEPGLEVVEAHSGAEALHALLKDDYAVALLDVNMPDMDGFETAALIRSRKRCAHMPIIFVTAHSDEMHARRGYAYGAVDYILTPVVPEVLRTKVNVFVQLFRMSRRASEQAAQDLARAERERERLAAVLESSSELVGRVTPGGSIALNRAGLAMLGYEGKRLPRLEGGAPEWAEAEAWRGAIAHAAGEGLWFGETTLRRADGGQVPVSLIVLAHRTPESGGGGGGIESYSVIARDISARRRAEQSLAESERRYRELVESLPAAVYTCDAEGKIELYNQAAVDLWGREPVIGRDRWCGSWKAARPDGAPLEIEENPMCRTVQGRACTPGEELVILRSDGTRRHVVPNPRALRDATGKIVGAVNMLMDITDLRSAEQGRALLAQIVDSTDDAVISKSLDGVVTWCNRGAEQLFGYTPEELVGQPGRVLIPVEHWSDEADMLARIRAGQHVEHYETVRRRKDGSLVDVSISLSPVRDSSGRVIGASKIARDITERKRAESELARYREHLEQLVQERTEELRASHDRLRQADRLASIGTLAAGLGHDMGNLLLPVRMRLDAMEQLDLPPEARDDLAAINSACEYLNRLSQGLRLFALNPEQAGAGEFTRLSRWWEEVFPFLRSVLSSEVALIGSFPEDVADIAMAPHVFTQVVFNLLQNAGDALRGRADGKIIVSACAGDEAGFVCLAVVDNGPGMSEETKRRCMEPFFTTKTRSISTGLGLALVSGALRNRGGTLQIDSTLGKGTTFRLSIPAVAPVGVAQAPGGAADAERRRACVDVSDLRTGAYIATVLRGMGLEVDACRWGPSTVCDLAVMDAAASRTREVVEFLDADRGRVAVLLGPGSGIEHERMVRLEASPPASVIRTTLAAAVKAPRSGVLTHS